MQIINKFRNYLLEEEFEIHILKNKVNIVNYQTIDHFDNNTVMIRYQDGILIIKGEHLVVSKLMQEEVLVEGNIKSIELR